VLGKPPPTVAGAERTCRKSCAGAGCLRDLTKVGAVRRPAGQGGRACQSRSEARDRRHARVHEPDCGGLVEQLGQGGGDHDGHRARLCAQPDPFADRDPGRRAPGVLVLGVGRLVVEDEDAVDRRVRADGYDDVAKAFPVTPDQRGVVERIAGGGGLRKQLAQSRGGVLGESGQPEPEPGALVGGQRRVAAGAGENCQPAGEI
jgi:hypothetical protein